MVDQVSPMGSLAPALSPTPPAAVKPPQAQEKPRATKAADPVPKRPEGQSAEQSAKALDSAIKEFKQYIEQSQSDLVFQVEQDTGHVYFKLVDAQTKEVIRQIPSEEILAMARKLRELADPKTAPGVLVDKEG